MSEASESNSSGASVETWAISPSLAHPHPSIDHPKITSEISPQNHCIPIFQHQLRPLGHLGRGWPSHEKLKRRGGPPGLTAGGMVPATKLYLWFMFVGSIICPIKYTYIMLYHMYMYIYIYICHHLWPTKFPIYKCSIVILYTIWLFNSSPWKITMLLIGKPSISMGHLYHGYVKKPEGIYISPHNPCMLRSELWWGIRGIQFRRENH